MILLIIIFFTDHFIDLVLVLVLLMRPRLRIVRVLGFLNDHGWIEIGLVHPISLGIITGSHTAADEVAIAAIVVIFVLVQFILEKLSLVLGVTTYPHSVSALV